MYAPVQTVHVAGSAAAVISHVTRATMTQSVTSLTRGVSVRRDGPEKLVVSLVHRSDSRAVNRLYSL